MSRMDRRKLRTRRQLMDALLSLMFTRDYDAITVQDITDTADLGRATFYLHYKDKHELLMSTMQMLMNDLIEHVEAEKSKLDDDTGMNIGLYFKYIQKNSAVYKAVLSENGMKYIAHQQLSYISEMVETILCEDVKKNDGIVPVPIVARFISGAIFSLILWWLEKDMPYTPEYMEQAIDQLINPGMCLNYGMPIEEFALTFDGDALKVTS